MKIKNQSSKIENQKSKLKNQKRSAVGGCGALLGKLKIESRKSKTGRDRCLRDLRYLRHLRLNSNSPWLVFGKSKIKNQKEPCRNGLRPFCDGLENDVDVVSAWRSRSDPSYLRNLRFKKLCLPALHLLAPSTVRSRSRFRSRFARATSASPLDFTSPSGGVDQCLSVSISG